MASIVGTRAAVDITTLQDRGAREPTRQGEVLLRWVSTAESCGASSAGRAAHAHLVQQLSTQDAPAGEDVEEEELKDQLGLEPLGAVRIGDRSTVTRRRLHRTTVGDLRDPSALEPQLVLHAGHSV